MNDHDYDGHGSCVPTCRGCRITELERERDELREKLTKAEERVALQLDWIRCANQFAWAHERGCPGYSKGGAHCTCGLDQFLRRPRPTMEAWKARAERAEAELAEARKDTERLKFLADAQARVEKFWMNDKQCWNWAIRDSRGIVGTMFPHFRAAIDAARKAEAGA